MTLFSAHRSLTVLRTVGAPAESKALIKLTLSFDSRLVVTQCYSVVKNQSAIFGVPPGWVEHFCPKFGAKRPALVGPLRNCTVVAADAQLMAVTRGSSLVTRFPPTSYQLRITTLVELTGIEPVTPWLQTRCSPS